MADTATEKKESKPKEARAEINISGQIPPETVQDALRLGAKKGSETVGKDPGKRKFADEIQGPTNKIIAKRLTPAKTMGGKALGDEYDLMTHDEMTEGEIKQEIMQNRGGQKWHVRVLDDKNEIICSKTLTVGGEPKQDPLIEELDTPAGDEAHGGDEVGEPQQPEEIISNDPDVIEAQKKQRLLIIENKNMEIQARNEELEAKRDESRLRRDRVRRGLLPGEMENGKGEPDIQQTIADAVEKATAPLTRQIDENKKAREKREGEDNLDRRMKPLEEMAKTQQKTLEDLIKKMSEPKGEPNAEMVAAIEKLGERMDQGKANPNAEMVAAINSMSSSMASNLSALQTNLLQTMAKGGDNKMGDAAVAALTQIAARQPGGAESDPFSAVQKTVGAMKGLMDIKATMEGKGESIPRDFPSLIVERVTDLAPEVMGFIKEQQKAGESVTKEMLETKMRDLGLKMWQGLEGTIKTEVRSGMKNLQGRVPQQVQQPATAAPGMGAPLPPPPGMGSPPQQQQAPIPPLQPAPIPVLQPQQVQQQEPIPVPQQVQQQPQQPIPAPQQPQQPGQQAVPNLDVEIRSRVNSVLQVLQREIQLGVQGPTWPELAYAHLPKDVIDRIVVANTDDQVYEAIKPWADPQMLESIWSFVSATNPKHEWYREWMTMGINWIKDASTGNLPGGDEQ